MKKIILINLIFLFCFIHSLFSEEFNGKVSVIDGDTIKIENVKIRLFGIDAPEIKQKCKKVYFSIYLINFQKEYDCGQVSKKALSKAALCATHNWERLRISITLFQSI